MTSSYVRTVSCITGAFVTGLAASSALLSAAPSTNGLRIHTSHVTGKAAFVTAADGGSIPLNSNVAAGSNAETFIAQYGRLFGVTDRAQQLVRSKVTVDRLGRRHTQFNQVDRGVPVFGGVLKVHENAQGGISAANGAFFPVPAILNVVPTISADQASAAAKQFADAPQGTIERSDLTIVDPGWYGDPPVGAHLVYHVVVADYASGVHQGYFIDAHTGKVLDTWALCTAKNRRVSIDGVGVVRTEGDPPSGDTEADAAYDWAGDTYDYLFRAFNRDGLDDFGGIMDATVHLDSSSCPNAFGSAGGTYYCDGVVTDDIVAHEFGHGLTENTAGLFYQNQAGQLNEAFSDVLGEIVDLLNGDAAFPGAPGGTHWPSTATGSGTDTPNDMRSGCVYDTLITANAPVSIAGDYGAQAASFGPALTTTGITGDLVVADPVRGCDIDLPFSNGAAMSGKIVLIDRGDCLFTEKVLNAQDQGAIGVIIASNLPTGLSPMGGSDGSVVIPSVGSSRDTGDALKAAALTDTVNVTLHQASSTDVRWLVGEDSSAFGGAIRDMWQPSCDGDPDRANDPLETCNPDDNGGVHSGSGVLNHMFAMLTDGQTFNGYTVNGIGLFKAGAVFHRTLTTYLTPTSDFEDAYAAFDQAATDLVGETIKDPRDGSDWGTFTSDDALEVDKAALAVELNTPGACGRSELLDTNPVNPCTLSAPVYSDDFESGVNGWTVSNSAPPTPYDWIQRSSLLPFDRPGTAWFAEDPFLGDCSSDDESAVHSLFSPVIPIDVGADPILVSFVQYFATEAFFDGGNVKVSIDGSPFDLVPRNAFTRNPYNSGLAVNDDTNPLAGEPAFTGAPLAGGGWGASIIDLTSFFPDMGPHTLQVRFDFSKDGCNGNDGWYLDDFAVYSCGQSVIVPDPVAAESQQGSRYLRFSAPDSGSTQAIRVKITSLNGYPIPDPDYLWVGPPFDAPEEDSGQPGLTFKAAPLQCTPYFRDWSTLGVVSVYGAEIIPDSTYQVQPVDITCPSFTQESCFASPVEIDTGRYADNSEVFQGPGNPPQPDFADISALVSKFLADPGAPIKALAQLQPNVVFPMRPIDFNDISGAVSAFLGTSYASQYPGPCVCPSTVTCGETPCSNDTQCGSGLCVNGFCGDACGRCTP